MLWWNKWKQILQAFNFVLSKFTRYLVGAYTFFICIMLYNTNLYIHSFCCAAHLELKCWRKSSKQIWEENCFSGAFRLLHDGHAILWIITLKMRWYEELKNIQVWTPNNSVLFEFFENIAFGKDRIGQWHIIVHTSHSQRSNLSQNKIQWMIINIVKKIASKNDIELSKWNFIGIIFPIFFLLFFIFYCGNWKLCNLSICKYIVVKSNNLFYYCSCAKCKNDNRNNKVKPSIDKKSKLKS